MTRHQAAGHARQTIMATCLLAALSAVPAHGAETAKASPRAAITVGGANVVMLAADDRLRAFVDRVADNAPVADAALSITMADGPRLNLLRVSDGDFVAAFSHVGHAQDTFLVSLASPDGNGAGAVELRYRDEGRVTSPSDLFDLRGSAGIAVVTSAIGAVSGAFVVLQMTTRRRRAGVAALGS